MAVEKACSQAGVVQWGFLRRIHHRFVQILTHLTNAEFDSMEHPGAKLNTAALKEIQYVPELV